MKKIAIVAFLALATVSSAMKYTGDVYVNATLRKAESLYLSVGCTVKNDSGVVESIGAEDVKVTATDQFGWFKVPVKTLLQGDTIAPFCFYRSLPDSVRTKVYDADSVLTGYVYVKSYMSTKTFTEDVFKNQENLYINFSSSFLRYEDVTPPKIFYKSNWKQDFVIVNGASVKIQKKKADGWSVVQDELKNKYVRRNIKVDSVQKMEYKVQTHCLEDAEGYCIYDEETGSSVMVRDTVDSSKVWVHTYDTLAIDTLYSLYNDKIVFADTSTTCYGHYTFLEYFNVNSAISNDFYCANTAYGIDVSSIKDSVYIFENPKKEHSTLIRSKAPGNVYRLYVLPPQVADWFGEIPVLGNGGSEIKTVMDVNDDHCGWYSTLFFEEALPTKATFSGKDNSSMQFAANTNVDSLYKKLNTTELYYAANDPNKIYWYAKYQEQEGICEVHLRGIVYDTDADLHPAFSCYSQGGEGCQRGAQGIPLTTAVKAIDECIGVTPGIVESLLGPDHKPVLSKTGEKCFIKSDLFDQLFNTTEGVNETSCSTIPFALNRYGKWEFSSDYFVSPGTSVVGGYYPAESKTDNDIVVGSPLATARKKREAEGPVFIGPRLRELDSIENVMKMNVLCKGIGWNKGINCTGLFADGEDIVSPAASYFGEDARSGSFCVWGWSCPNQAPEDWAYFKDGTETYTVPNAGNPRWRSLNGRNQHFCFESHAKFTYKKGQRFGVRGDDDIWIFIGGKLAIDLGGTHMAAPGYADLSRLTDANGDALVVGKTYDIDIFFCDRRTTMSNMNFFSNIYLDQSESVEAMKPCEVEVQHIFDDDSLNPRTKTEQRDIALPSPKIGVMIEGRVAHFSGLVSGSEAVLLDLQGRVIGRYLASTANVKIEIRNAGRYILKTKSGLQPFTIK